MAGEKTLDDQGVRAQPTVHAVKTTKTTPPPLKHGDYLTRDEFEPRYEAMPHLKKAELIKGVVYTPSPVRFAIHGQPHDYIMAWVGVHCAATPGG